MGLLGRDWGGSLPSLAGRGVEDASSEFFFLVLGGVLGVALGDLVLQDPDPLPEEFRLRILPRAARGLLDCWTPNLFRF